MKTTHKRLPSRASRAQGFTLVEMLMVIVILGILAAIVYPKITGRSLQAQVTSAKLQIANISAALKYYEIDNASYPGSLNALFEQPANTPNWHGPYLEKGIPKDPWGNDYLYDYPGKHNPGGFDLISAGPDSRTGTEDDITNW